MLRELNKNMFIEDVFIIMKYTLILLLLFAMRCVSKPSLSETTALQSLYNQTNGNKWNWQPDYQEYGIPWNFTQIKEQNPCKQSSPWQGVNCIEDESFITSLKLSDYNLNGTLPINLDQLKALTFVELSSNFNLTGKYCINLNIYNKSQHL